MMFDVTNFAISATVTMSFTYIFYTLAMAFFPKFFVRTHASMIHLTNYNKYLNDINVTLEGFLWGLGQVIFHSFLTAWIFAYIYNALLMQ